MSEAPGRPPYESYAAIAGTFAGLLATAGALGRALDRDPRPGSALDLAVLAAATFKVARTMAEAEVTSFVREPFVRGHAHAGDDEEPVRGGTRQALGELVTCTRCLGTWAATGLLSTQVLAPRFGRIVTWSFAAAAANDFLQAAFSALTATSNRLAAETER